MIPFDIIALIVDIVGENKDTNVLKELALVSHSFLQICNKHLFATVELHDADPRNCVASSKKGFVKLLESRPDVAKYIRKLVYKVGNNILINDDHLLSPILSNFLPTFSCLNCLTIDGSRMEWNKLDSSLISAFLHLMRLPTINHIDLSYIDNFPLSSLTPSVNLLRLDISHLLGFDHGSDYGSPLISVQMEMMPKIREFHTSNSSLLTTQLLYAVMRDEQPAFDLMDLRRLSFTSWQIEDEINIRYLLQNAKLLQELRLSADQSLVGVLSLSVRTLKVLDLVLHIPFGPLLAGLCEELEAMAGRNMLEALSIEVHADVHDAGDFIGSKLRELENVLVKPGWSALRRVSFKVAVDSRSEHSAWLSMALVLSLPDKYFGHLSKLESVAFNYSTGLF